MQIIEFWRPESTTLTQNAAKKKKTIGVDARLGITISSDVFLGRKGVPQS